MTSPVAPGSGLPLSSPYQNRKIERGDSALTAPTTPGKRMPTVDRSKASPEVIKAAEGMEGMFLEYMMKVMRDTVPQNEMDLESPASGIYRSMLDHEVAQKASRTNSVGIADQVIAYLQPESYNVNKGKQAPQAAQRTAPPNDRTGGTHEGRPVE